MYYDVLLSAFGFIALLADPGKFVRPIFARFGARAGGAWERYLRPRLARAHPALAAPSAIQPPVPADGAWVVNSFVLYALTALIVIHTCFTYLGLSATMQAARFPPRQATVTSEGGVIDVIGSNGQPVKKTPQLEVTTNQSGPAWTLLLWGCGPGPGAVMIRFAYNHQAGTTNDTNP